MFVLSNGLISENSGGMAGGPSLHGGFDYLNQLIQVPTNFAGAATIAKADGRYRRSTSGWTLYYR